MADTTADEEDSPPAEEEGQGEVLDGVGGQEDSVTEETDSLAATDSSDEDRDEPLDDEEEAEEPTEPGEPDDEEVPRPTKAKATKTRSTRTTSRWWGTSTRGDAPSDEKAPPTWVGRLAVPLLLLSFFLLAMFIRSYFYWQVAVQPVEDLGVNFFSLSGNDPNYHKRVIDYVQLNHRQLIIDPLLSYPNGAVNPNPPLFEWSIVLLGYLLSPFLGNDVQLATWYAHEFGSAFWASMTIFPVYAYAKDMFGRRPAILSAFFIAVMAGNVERTPVGFSDHDAFVVFFVVVALFFLMRALRGLREGTYVERWGDFASVTRGVDRFLKHNRKPLLNAVMSGLAIATVFLAWKGIAYLEGILLVYLVFHLLVKRARKEESLGIGVIILTTLAVALIIPIPYYAFAHLAVWYETPLFIWAFLAIIVLFLVPSRNTPWTLLLAEIGGTVALVYVVASRFFPQVWQTLTELQGYFLRTKLYTTIAEAQAPDFSRLVFSYGIATFFLALIGLVLLVLRLRKERFRNDLIITLIWSGMSFYLATSAVRFVYNGTPVVAIMAGWVAWEVIERTGFDRLSKSMAMTTGAWNKLRQINFWHVSTTLFVVLMLIVPNVWYGVDAGIPFETKQKYDKEVYDALPSFLRPGTDVYDPDTGGLWYLGAFGTAFPSDYWLDSLHWLAQQDTDLPIEDRPAFVSWWDYGHWSVHWGEHPSAADNFQHGYQFTGQMITAPNESVSIALMAARIAEGTYKNNPQVEPYLRAQLGDEVTNDLLDLYKNPGPYAQVILDDPDTYGRFTEKYQGPGGTTLRHDLDPLNVKWAYGSRTILNALDGDEDRLVDFLAGLEGITGKQMRYFAVDSRLFPYSASNTGIFYAPVRLSDQEIDDFLLIEATLSNGQTVKSSEIKGDLQQQIQRGEVSINSFSLTYEPPFLDSLFYRAYVGYSGADIGRTDPTCLPAMRVSQVKGGQNACTQLLPLQGWGLEHWKLVYRSQYWNPNATDLSNHTDEWRIVSPELAAELSGQQDPELAGTLDTTLRGLLSGVFYLRYYPGVVAEGAVTASDGSPVANARVTVFDDLKALDPSLPGVPHQSVRTDAQGHYRIILPPGEVLLRVTNGGDGDTNAAEQNRILMQDYRLLAEQRLTILPDQAERSVGDLNGDGQPDWKLRQDFVIPLASVEGNVYWDVDGDGSLDAGTDLPISGSIRLSSVAGDSTLLAQIGTDGTYRLTDVIPGDYQMVLLHEGTDFTFEQLKVDPSDHLTEDRGVTPAGLNGTLAVIEGSNTSLAGAQLVLRAADGHSVARTRTNATGAYVMTRLLPGTFNLTLEEQRFFPAREPVSLIDGANSSVNLTIRPTSTVIGVVQLPDGSPAANATLLFAHRTNQSLTLTATAGAGGSYRAYLAAGSYALTVQYARGGLPYGMLQDLEVVGEGTVVELPVQLARATAFSGRTFIDTNGNNSYDLLRLKVVSGPGGPGNVGGGGLGDIATKPIEGVLPGVGRPEEAGHRSVTVFGPLGLQTVRTDAAGHLSLLLPSGDYTILANSKEQPSGAAQTKLRQLSVGLTPQPSATLDLQLSNGTIFDGVLFEDRNDDGLTDPGEHLRSGTVSLTPSRGTPFSFPIDINGTFNWSLPAGTYHLRAAATGYVPADTDVVLSGTHLTKPVALVRSQVPVELHVGTDEDGDGIVDAGVALPLQLRGAGTSQEVSSDLTGNLSLDLLPGSYSITVDTNRTEEGSTVRYKGATTLNLTLGDGPTIAEFPLQQLLHLQGTLYRDSDHDGAIDQSERRNGRVEAYAAGGHEAGTARADSDGRFELYLPQGAYSLHARESDLLSPSGVSVALLSVDLDGPTAVILKLETAVRLFGHTYSDGNGDGIRRISEDRPEVPILLRVDGQGWFPATSNDAAEFEVFVPATSTLHLLVDSPDTDTDGTPTGVRLVADLPLSIDTEDRQVDVAIEEFVDLSGTLSFDSDGDGKVDAGEELANVTLSFPTDAGVITARTDAAGRYAVAVPAGTYHPTIDAPGYDTNLSSLNVAAGTPAHNLTALATHLQVSGTIFGDSNGNGKLDGSEAGLALSITLHGAGESIVNLTSDSFGNIAGEAKAGNYTLWVGSGSGPATLALATTITIAPGRGGADLLLPLAPTLKLKVTPQLHDESGAERSLAGVNITVTAALGQEQVVPATTVQELFLPAGNYSLHGSTAIVEFGRPATYTLDQQVVLDHPQALSVPFEKELALYARVEAVAPQLSGLQANDSINVTLHVTNVGNSPETFRLRTTSVPAEWKVAFDPQEVTLGLDQMATVVATVNVSAKPNGGENSLRFNATPKRDGTQGGDLRLTASVDLVSSVQLSPAANAVTIREGAFVFTFTVANDGNHQEGVNLTIASLPQGWLGTLDNYNPSVPPGKTADVQVTVRVPAGAAPGAKTFIDIAARAEGGGSDRLSLPVDFPDLVVGKGAIKVEGAKVSLKKSTSSGRWLPIPSFEAPLAVLALGVVLVLHHRRREG